MPLVIYPYLLVGRCWVFDDPCTGLKEEAFVLGMSEMISRVVEIKSISNAASGFALMFDSAPFDHDIELKWISGSPTANTSQQEPDGGNWYEANVFGQVMTGWLCPALFLYFPLAPQ